MSANDLEARGRGGHNLKPFPKPRDGVASCRASLRQTMPTSREIMAEVSGMSPNICQVCIRALNQGGRSARSLLPVKHEPLRLPCQIAFSLDSCDGRLFGEAVTPSNLPTCREGQRGISHAAASPLPKAD
ncbi:hypothetical protein ELG88_22825 [Rhizobium leguminosarum]|nr:hypothetical protein ELG88_22825 [Rhizobium leguminosarum]